MAKLDESQIIRIFQKRFGSFVSEDVESFRLGKGFGIIKIDTLVESTDVPPGMTPAEAARKSVVACVSDFASKGVRPLYGTISVTIPKSYSEKKIRGLAAGFAKSAKEFGFRILGGDTNEGVELVISVSLFGTSERITYRKGARTGDHIIVTGPFGNSYAGLKHVMHGKKAERKFARKIKSALYRPLPRLGFGVLAARYFSSAMDSSDGLSTTLNEMAKQSKKKFEITALPHDSELERFASQNRLDIEDLVLNGGEEYEIVATIPHKNLKKVKQLAKSHKIPLTKIGQVGDGGGVFYSGKRIRSGGWLHFR